MAFLETKFGALHYKYVRNGQRETLVLINSLGTSLQLWEAVEIGLQSDFNLLLFDKRGHGLSSTSEGDVSIDDYADDIVTLMDHLEIEKVHPVGLSIGGLITYSLASRYPERIGKLIFSNTGAKIGTEDSWNERIEFVTSKGLGAMASNIVTRWLSETYLKAHPEVQDGMITMLKTTSDQGYIQACDAIRRADYNPFISQLKNSAIYIGGGADPGTTAAFVKEQADRLDVPCIIIPDIGHLPCIETPIEMVDIIRNFIWEETDSTYELGMRTRRAVLGDAHVDRAESQKTDFDEDFQKYIVNSAWGSIWSRPGLTKRERSLITLALLASLGHYEELEMHIRACSNTGASESDIKEVLLHTGVYAGVPVTNNAMKIAKKIIQDK